MHQLDNREDNNDEQQNTGGMPSGFTLQSHSPKPFAKVLGICTWNKLHCRKGLGKGEPSQEEERWLWENKYFNGAASVVVEWLPVEQQKEIVRKARIHAIQTLAWELHQEKMRRDILPRNVPKPPIPGFVLVDDYAYAMKEMNDLVKKKHRELQCDFDIVEFKETPTDAIHPSTVHVHISVDGSTIRTKFNLLKQMLDYQPDIVEIRTAYPTVSFSVAEPTWSRG